MRHAFGKIMVLGGFMLACAGCGANQEAERLVGTYAVMIDAGGTADSDRMTASVGSRGAVLLNFVFGFSQLRGSVADTALELLPQTVRVQHSTGATSGTGSGQGTIDTQGLVDLTLTVASAASDGGTAPSRTFHITGQRN